MRSIVRALLGSLVLLSLAAPVTAAGPAGDLKAVTTTQLKAVKDYAKQRFAACGAEIGVVTDQVRLALVSAPDGLEAVATAAGNCIADVVARAVDARTDVTEQGSALLAGGGTGTLGFLVGDGSILDQFVAKLNAELEKFRKQIDKRLRVHGAAVAKATNGSYRQTVVVSPLRMDVAPQTNTPPPSTSLDDLIAPSRLFLAVAGSSTAFPTDGKACVSGRSFVTLGTPALNVQIFGPAVASRLGIVPGAGTGRWRACFTGLPVGNYRLFIDQDPDQDAIFGETPTEYSTIGVP